MLRIIEHATNGEPYNPDINYLCAGSDTKVLDPSGLTEEGTVECPLCARHWGTQDEVAEEREACATLADANNDADTAAAIRARAE
jgi:hypothetical protein